MYSPSHKLRIYLNYCNPVFSAAFFSLAIIFCSSSVLVYNLRKQLRKLDILLACSKSNYELIILFHSSLRAIRSSRMVCVGIFREASWLPKAFHACSIRFPSREYAGQFFLLIPIPSNQFSAIFARCER